MAKEKRKGKGEFTVNLETLIDDINEHLKNIKIGDTFNFDMPFGNVGVEKVESKLPVAEYSAKYTIGEKKSTKPVVAYLTAWCIFENATEKAKFPKMPQAVEKWLLRNPEFIKVGMGGNAAKIEALAAENSKSEDEEEEMPKGKTKKSKKEGKKSGKKEEKKIEALTEEELASKVKLKSCKETIEELFDDSADEIIESAFGDEKATKMKKLVKAIEKAGFEIDDEDLLESLREMI